MFEGKYILKLIPGKMGVNFNKFFTNASITLTPTIDNSGRLVTGLTEDAMVKNASGKMESKRGTRVFLEKALNLEDGELNPGFPTNPNPFWLRYNFKVTQTITELDASNPMDLLHLSVLAKHNWVDFLDESDKPNPHAKLKLYSKEAQVKKANSKVKISKKANELFGKMSIEDMVAMLQANYKVRATDMMVEEVENKLYNLLTEDPSKFISLAENKIERQIFSAIKKGVIKHTDDGFAFGDTYVGEVESDVVIFFTEHKEQLAELQIKI